MVDGLLPLNEPVGRGRPPKHSRFQKGKSGNPLGRPPKDRDLKNLIEKELDAVVTLTDNGRKVRLTKREVLARKVVNDALKGDSKALQALIKLSGGAPESEPTVSIEPEELARFLLRFAPNSGEEDE